MDENIEKKRTAKANAETSDFCYWYDCSRHYRVLYFWRFVIDIRNWCSVADRTHCKP